MGLREQKKQDTRAAITEATLELIDTLGYPATTVSEIASAANVSHRTFYNYFASKEDVILAGTFEFYDQMLSTIAARPNHEHPMLAVRLAALAAAEVPVPNQDRIARLVALIDAEPALAARLQASLRLAQDGLAAEFARRLGADESDIKVRVLAAAAVASFQIAMRTWVARGATDSPLQFGIEALELFGSGLDEIGA